MEKLIDMLFVLNHPADFNADEIYQRAHRIVLITPPVLPLYQFFSQIWQVLLFGFYQVPFQILYRHSPPSDTFRKQRLLPYFDHGKIEQKP